MRFQHFLCPICRAALTPGNDGKSYRCPAGHAYDTAHAGYVNLLPPAGHGRHGDDKLMVRARTAFLDRGFYDPLARAVADAAVRTASSRDVTLIDAGCGEGKYTADVINALTAGGHVTDAVGLDISREAIVAAKRRIPALYAAVAGTSAMPLPDAGADLLLNIFSPFFGEEFARVLAPGGTLLRVIPTERHLWELKALVYDVPYPNVLPEAEAPGFTLCATQDIAYTVTLPTHEDIMNLFMMTPYYYKTGIGDQAKTRDLCELTVSLGFRLLTYSKNPRSAAGRTAI